MPGRKPTELKRLQGTLQKCRTNPDEPTPTTEIPSPPEPVAINPTALAEWKRITPILAEFGLISGMDMAELAFYCLAYARWIDAERHLSDEGLIITTSNGNVVQSVWLGISNRAMHQMHDFARQFGMTPASRACVKGVKKEPENPLAAFMEAAA